MPISNHRTKGTLRFALKEPNSKNESPIQLIFSLGEVRVRKSIGYKVEPGFWDKNKQRVKNVIQAFNKDEINRELNDLEGYINGTVSELKKTKRLISSRDIKTALSDYKKPKEEKTIPNDFFSVFERFIDAKDRVLPRNRGNKNQTVEVYKQAVNLIKRFQNDTHYLVSFDSIDLDFYMEFVDYMQSIEKKGGGFYSLNTIGKHLKSLKTFLNYATNVGLNTNFKYKLSEFKILKEQTTAVYLTREEMKKLFDFDFSKYPDLELARDIFVIGCEIGQRVSDYNNLRNSEIVRIDGKLYFKIRQKKTRELVYCFITPAIKSIMSSRHNSKPPKSIPEQFINKNIKQASQMVGIDSEIRFERTEGGEKKVKHLPKYELISSHTARRTYCSILFNEGVSIQKIMTQSGHKTEKEFRNYIRISKEEEVREITNSEEFNRAFIDID